LREDSPNVFKKFLFIVSITFVKGLNVKLSSKFIGSENKFVVMFFGLTLLIGALGYIPWVLASYGMFPILLSVPFFFIGGGSPTFATIIVSLIEYGKKGPEYLFGQYGRKGFSKMWFLAPILLSFGIIVFSLGILSMFAGVNYVNLQRLVVFVPVLISVFCRICGRRLVGEDMRYQSCRKSITRFIQALL